MAMGINLNANSPGERFTMALMIVALLIEMLSNNSCNPAPRAEPITHADCAYACSPRPIHRWESWACECEPSKEEHP